MKKANNEQLLKLVKYQPILQVRYEYVGIFIEGTGRNAIACLTGTLFVDNEFNPLNYDKIKQ